MNILAGMKDRFYHTVQETDLATNWKNDVPVLATPVLLWLSELACMKVLEQAELEPELMTVGYSHDSKHLAATPLGVEIYLDAILTKMDHKKLTFFIVAYDNELKIYEGVHERFIVNKQRFIEKLPLKEVNHE